MWPTPHMCTLMSSDSPWAIQDLSSHNCTQELHLLVSSVPPRHLREMVSQSWVLLNDVYLSYSSQMQSFFPYDLITQVTLTSLCGYYPVYVIFYLLSWSFFDLILFSLAPWISFALFFMCYYSVILCLHFYTLLLYFFPQYFWMFLPIFFLGFWVQIYRYIIIFC